MRSRARRSSLFFPAGLTNLESRRLLAISIMTGDDAIIQSGDFTNSSSSVGSDGYEDLKIKITGLEQKDVKQVHVIGTRSDNSTYTWRYGQNIQAFDYAEFIRITKDTTTSFPSLIDQKDQGTATIYCNPPASGSNLASFVVTVHYDDGTCSTSTSVSLPSPNPDPYIALRKSVAPSNYGSTTFLAGAAEFLDGQYTGTETSSKKLGDIRIKLTSLPSGFVYNDIQYTYLDNGTGSWEPDGDKDNLLKGTSTWSDVSTKGSFRLGFESASPSHIANIYARPIRNEIDSKMTLVVELKKNNVTSYMYTQFDGKQTDETLAERSNAYWVEGTSANYKVYIVSPNQYDSTMVDYKLEGHSSPDGQNVSLRSLLAIGGALETGALVKFASGTFMIPQNDNEYGLNLNRPMYLKGSSGTSFIFKTNSTAVGGSHSIASHWRSVQSSPP